MRLLPFLLLSCLLLAAPILPAGAEDEPAEAVLEGEALRAQVERWIAELRSDAFEVREAARTGLKSHGLKVRDLLEAAEDDEDPEVRRTVRSLLAGAGSAPVRANPTAKGGALDAMGLVTLSVQDVPLEEALRALGETAGAAFDVPTEAKTRKVSLDVEGVPFFTALRALLDAGGLRMPKSFDAAGSAALVLAGDAPAPPWAAAGPLLVQVVEVTATRALDADRPPRYALKLRVQWAPSVQVAQYEMPRVEVARDEQAGIFKATAGPNRSVRYGVGQSTRSATVQAHIEPAEAESGDVLATLEVVLPIAGLQHDLARVRLQDTARIPVCLGPDGETAAPDDDGAVRFQSLEESDDGRGQWVADITATLLDPVPQRTVQAFTADAEGRIERLQVYGGRSRGADGTVRLTARSWRSGAEKPAGLVVTWFRRESSGSLRFRFTNVPLR